VRRHGDQAWLELLVRHRVAAAAHLGQVRLQRVAATR
jgi:hypothetical protein